MSFCKKRPKKVFFTEPIYYEAIRRHLWIGFLSSRNWNEEIVENSQVTDQNGFLDLQKKL